VRQKASPRETVDLLSLGFASRYMRRLIADRDNIRSALLSPGGSVILTGVSRDLEGTDEYSSQLGNDYHLDLIQAEMELTNNCEWCSDLPRFTKLQIDTLLSWAKALSPEEAATSGLLTQSPGALRRYRHHTVAKLTDRMKTDG
jgi:hypothetical protein